MQIAETVWNDGPGSGTGGGVSDVNRSRAGRRASCRSPRHFAGRAIPDVAANADPATGRINASLGARSGNFNALLYSKFGPAGVLRDITVGNNDTGGLLGGQYKAGPGWDACTGWGVPDGGKLLTALQGGHRFRFLSSGSFGQAEIAACFAGAST